MAKKEVVKKKKTVALTKSWVIDLVEVRDRALLEVIERNSKHIHKEFDLFRDQQCQVSAQEESKSDAKFMSAISKSEAGLKELKSYVDLELINKAKDGSLTIYIRENDIKVNEMFARLNNFKGRLEYFNDKPWYKRLFAKI